MRMTPPRAGDGMTLLQRVNPTAKLVVFSVLILVPALVLDPATPAACLLFAFGLGWAAGGIAPPALARRLTPLLGAAAGLTLFTTIGYGGARRHLLFSVGPLEIWAEGLASGASVGLRLVCIAALSTLFVATTDPTVLVASLIHQARVPYRLGYTLLAAYRFVPILTRELGSIHDAHRLRQRGDRHLRARLGGMRRYGVPLLVGAVRRAERLALAMDARGFGALPERTYYVRPRLTARDLVFVAAVLGIAGALVTLLRLVPIQVVAWGAVERLVTWAGQPL